jgi:hypothetical protein
VGIVTIVKDIILIVLSFIDANFLSFLLCDLLQITQFFEQVNGKHVNGKQDIV